MVNGYLLNNQLTDFSFTSVDAVGLPVANRVEPGKRPRSSMSPLLVFDKASGELEMSLGLSLIHIWDGDVFHRQQVFHGKVQADTKHQQDDADFGQLGGEPQIGDIARRKGAAYHASREVAHHGGDAQAACQHAEEVGQHEAAYQGSCLLYTSRCV